MGYKLAFARQSGLDSKKSSGSGKDQKKDQGNSFDTMGAEVAGADQVEQVAV